MIDKIITCCFYILQAVIQIIMLNKNAPRKIAILPASFFFLLYFAAAVAPIPLPLGLPLTTACLVFYCRLALQSNWGAAILNGVLSAEIMWLSIGLADSLIVLITGGANAVGIPIIGSSVMVIGYILPLAAYCVMFSAAKKIIHGELEKCRSIWIILFPLFLFFAAEIYIVKVIYRSAELGAKSGSDLNTLLFQILSSASVFCVLYAYKKYLDNSLLEQRIMLFEHERNFQIQYVRDAKARCGAAKSLRHDLKNHMIIIDALLLKKQYQKASEYVKKLDKLACESELSYNTDSLILDVILNNKLAAISNDSVDIQVKVGDIPNEIDETDICTIFANAVDNAIHALSGFHDKDKFFLIATERRGDLFFIKFENSFDGKPFKSGTGLENINAAAGKYNGTVQITTADNVFVLKVIMCFSQH